MSIITRRLSAAVLAAAVLASFSVAPAFAQYTPGAPTVGPAGGVSSTTAPSNSQGTPAGGTGTLGTTRVAPASVAPASGDQPSVSARPSRHRRHELRRARHHRRHHRAAETGTQSQDGTNGAMPPASR